MIVHNWPRRPRRPETFAQTVTKPVASRVTPGAGTAILGGAGYESRAGHSKRPPKEVHDGWCSSAGRRVFVSLPTGERKEGIHPESGHRCWCHFSFSRSLFRPELQNAPFCRRPTRRPVLCQAIWSLEDCVSSWGRSPTGQGCLLHKCLRRTAMLTRAMRHLWKIDRSRAFGIGRARQIGGDARLSEYEACEAAWATRHRLHSFIEISRGLVINTGNTLE